MNILKDVTEGIEPFPLLSYQQVLWNRMNQGGFKKGQMTLYSAVQQTGKSTFLKSAYYNNLCNEIMLPMKPAPKYKFSRAKWYEVHLFSKSWDPVQERLNWCEQTFGPQPKNPDAWSRWYTSFTTLRFRDSKDYEWFMLRWS
jgi:hypothetical protein